MVSTSNLFQWFIIFTLLIFCHLSSTTSLEDTYPSNDFNFGDDLYDTLPIEHHRLHQNYRRASLRYHPHILYKKASLRPIIGHKGIVSFTKRDRVRRSASSWLNSA